MRSGSQVGEQHHRSHHATSSSVDISHSSKRRRSTCSKDGRRLPRMTETLAASRSCSSAHPLIVGLRQDQTA
jgi:hypothetical protein